MLIDLLIWPHKQICDRDLFYTRKQSGPVSSRNTTNRIGSTVFFGISLAGLLTFLWMIHLNFRHNYNIFPRRLFHIYIALVHGMVCLSHNRVKFLWHYLCTTLVQCSNYTPACLRLFTLHKIGNLLDLNFWSWHNLTNTSVHIFRATTNLVVCNAEFFFLFQVSINLLVTLSNHSLKHLTVSNGHRSGWNDQRWKGRPLRRWNND